MCTSLLWARTKASASPHQVWHNWHERYTPKSWALFIISSWHWVSKAHYLISPLRHCNNKNIFCRTTIEWRDERYKTGNEHRKTECKFNDVKWENAPNAKQMYVQTWLPEFSVLWTDVVTNRPLVSYKENWYFLGRRIHSSISVWLPPRSIISTSAKCQQQNEIFHRQWNFSTEHKNYKGINTLCGWLFGIPIWWP